MNIHRPFLCHFVKLEFGVLTNSTTRRILFQNFILLRPAVQKRILWVQIFILLRVGLPGRHISQLESFTLRVTSCLAEF